MAIKQKLRKFIPLLSLLPGFLSGQSTADSLWSAYHKARTDTAKVNILLQLGTGYINSQRDSATLLLDQCLIQSEKSRYPSGAGKAHLQIGILQHRQSDYQAAMNHLNKAVGIFEQLRDQQNLALAYNRLGLASYRLTDYSNALDYYEKSFQIESRFPDSKQTGGLLQNMALVYERLDDYPKALDLFFQSLAHKKKEGEDKQLINTYSAIGTVYQKIRQFEEAKKNYRTALNLAEKFEDPRGMILANYNIGTVLEAEGKKDEALSLYLDCLKQSRAMGLKSFTATIVEALGNISMYKNHFEQAEAQFMESLELKEEMGDQHGIGYTYVNLADLYLRTNRIPQAETSVESAFQVGRIRNIPDLRKECYYLLMKIDSVKGDFNSALRNYRLGHELADSLISQEVEKKVAGLAARNELQSAKIKLKESESKLVTLKARNQRNWLLGIGITLLLILILLLALWRSYLQKQRINRQLAEKNLKLQESNDQLQVYNQQLGLANNKLQQFTFAASHDLRESSRSVTSFAQLLQKEFSGKKDSNGYLDYILEGSMRMNKTLDDLLSYTDLSYREDPAKETDLRELIRQSVNLLPEDSRHKSYSLNIHELPPVSANPVLLKKLFLNLIDNAIRFGREGVHPEIDIMTFQNEEGTVFCVKDNGAGMETKYLEQIFEPFYRLHQRGKSGSGLGLAVCERIVHQYKGRIWAAQEKTGGLGIYFTLPEAL